MKNNKLTAQDLMIGDWVEFHQSNGKCFYAYVEALNNYKIFSERGIFDDNEVSPIMLTAEILEKNGFIRDGESWWYQDFRIVLSTSRGVSLVCGRQKRFAFVHELQHALKLCEIEKEVIL